jgi:hypothetical protein
MFTQVCTERNEARASTATTRAADTVAMAAGEILAIRAGIHRRVIACCAGALWITQEGDPVDYRIVAGEEFTAERRGKIVVQALEASVMTLGTHLPASSHQAGRR